MIVLALISIVYGALVAIGQDDVLRLIGLTSLSHFGFITLGIFALTSQGSSGAILYMVNHGIGTAALFLIAGYIYHRRGTMLISEMGGLEKVDAGPRGRCSSSPASPPSACRASARSSPSSWCWCRPSTTPGGPARSRSPAIVLAAIYVLWMYQRTMTGPTPPERRGHQRTSACARSARSRR